MFFISLYPSYLFILPLPSQGRGWRLGFVIDGMSSRWVAKHQIVAMDDGFGAGVSQNLRNHFRAATPNLLQFLAVVVDNPSGNFLAVAIAQLHCILALEVALYLGNPCGQK